MSYHNQNANAENEMLFLIPFLNKFVWDSMQSGELSIYTS